MVHNFCVGEALSIPLLHGTSQAATHPLIRAVLRRSQQAPRDQAYALGWLGTDEYLALAARSLQSQVAAPLRQRGIPITAA